MRYSRMIALACCLGLLSLLVVPLTAQETADPGAGNGGVIVEANLGDDPSTFNPVISADGSSNDVIDLMYPDIIGLDDVTLEEAPNVPQALATGWEYDDTGTVLTLTLREDAMWADGEPITAEDWVWAYEAIRSGEAESPIISAIYELDDGSISGGTIHSVTVIDDYTLEITLGTVETDEAGEPILDENGNPQLIPNCEAISDLNDIPVVPAHAYDAAFGDDFLSMSDDPYFIPETANGIATFGPFTDPFIEFGVQTSLLADQNFPDTELGYVAPSEWIYQNVEDQTVAYERFLAGDFTWEGISPANQNDFRQREGFQVIEYPSNGYAYMVYNLADPNNPQPGRDNEGNIIDQGLHPFFSDVRVRQALAYAVDVREIIGTRPTEDSPATGILEGNGYPIATHNHPGLSSTDDELAELGVEPYPFQPERARELLNEAGWVDTDGNGILECQGCLYAQEVDPEFEGEEFQFELLTNAGNNIRESVGETIRGQLEDVGVVVNFQAIEFGTLVDTLLGQSYDAVIVSWGLALPFNPGGGLKSFFGIGSDRPGAGFNTGSYHNPDLDSLVERADSLPAADDGSYTACDQEARDDIYAEGQQIIWEDQPYLFLYAANTMIAGQGNVANFDPLPYNPTWNIDAWTIND